MKVTAKIILLVYAITAINYYAYTQSANTHFFEINELLSQKSFIKAKKLYKKYQSSISSDYCYYIEACLNNAFNRLRESEKMVGKLIVKKEKLPTALMVHLWEIKKDNAIKLYCYKEAATACHKLIKEYTHFFDEKKISDLRNDLQLWSALANVPSQTVFVSDNTTLRVNTDKAGLKNIKVNAGSDTLDFIFDTGANISTVSRSVAEKMGMEIIPGTIKVGAITGKDVTAQVAVCTKLLIGNIVLNNAVFLVFDDADLLFPQINYQINGILGFPVIEAMTEITITQDGYLHVAKNRHAVAGETNMALNELIPLVFIDDDPFTFDTGADKTILYRPYFLSNREAIVQRYQPDTISFGGAGGGHRFAGYEIDTSIQIAQKNALLTTTSLLIDDFGKADGIYGNIGQDVIRQFKAMTLNFKNMFIRFE